MEIRIEDLNQFYGKKQALKHVDLVIPSGMFGLLGKNGAGKTTLMKVLAALLKKSSGKVTICGVPVENTREIRSITGYLPQDFSMYGNMSAAEALDYLGALSGMKKAERRKRIPLLLEEVNLGGKGNVRIRAMSGGMRRRLGIAQDRIVILSTHIVGDVEATCENIGILNEGELIYQGTVEQLLNMAEGRVYTAEISRLELGTLQEMYPVTSILTVGNSATVRFISDVPPVFQAERCRAGVEDASLYLMHLEKEGLL